MSEVVRHGLLQPRSRPSTILSDFRSSFDDGSICYLGMGAVVDATEPFVAVRSAWKRIRRGVIQPEDLLCGWRLGGWLLEPVCPGPGHLPCCEAFAVVRK